MMTPRALRLSLLAAALLGGGCVHAGATGRLTPPVAIDRLPYEDFPTPANLSMEVTVDSLGHADASTLRLSGAVPADTRSVIMRWIGYARFTPARAGGRAIASQYRTRIKSMLSVDEGQGRD